VYAAVNVPDCPGANEVVVSEQVALGWVSDWHASAAVSGCAGEVWVSLIVTPARVTFPVLAATNV